MRLCVQSPNLDSAKKTKKTAVSQGWVEAGASDGSSERKKRETRAGRSVTSCHDRPQVPTRIRGLSGLMCGPESRDTAQGVDMVEKISMKLLNVRAMVIQDRVYFLLSKYVIIGPERDSTENDWSAIDNDADFHVNFTEKSGIGQTYECTYRWRSRASVPSMSAFVLEDVRPHRGGREGMQAAH